MFTHASSSSHTFATCLGRKAWRNATQLWPRLACGMVRKLKYHESKLLKKVDFLQWKSDATLREAHIMRRYLVQDRDDYRKYNRLVGGIRKVGRARALRTRSMRMCVCV